MEIVVKHPPREPELFDTVVHEVDLDEKFFKAEESDEERFYAIVRNWEEDYERDEITELFREAPIDKIHLR